MRRVLPTCLSAIVIVALSLIAVSVLGAQRSHSGPYRVTVRAASGANLPTYQHRGRAYVLGQLGQRYEIVVRNNSSRRVEAVVSVDGLDAIDGKRADFGKRGYIINAHDTLRIDGFRVSMRNVAAFRFSAVRDSYAARKGKPRNVGLIGVAIFPQRRRRRPPYRPWRPYGSGDKGKRRHPHRDSEMGGDSPSRSENEAAPTAGHKHSAARRPSAGRNGLGSKSGGRYGFEPKTKRSRPRGLGTEFGERRFSPVHETRFVRANKRWPAAQLSVRYNDRAGLRQLGINLNPWRPRWRKGQHRRETARAFRQSPRDFSQPPPGR